MLWTYRLFRVPICIALAVVVIGCTVIITTGLFIVSRSHGSAVLPADCAIVFGGAVYGHRPGPAIVRRVEAAAAAYRQGKIQTLFLTGGKGWNDVSTEAQAMEDLAMEQGVRSQDIILEERARSTWENLLFTRPLTGSCASVVGISDAFHLARIELLARRQGWGSLTTLPTNLRPTSRSALKSFLREVFAYLYYVLRTDRI